MIIFLHRAEACLEYPLNGMFIVDRFEGMKTQLPRGEPSWLWAPLIWKTNEATGTQPFSH